MEQLLGSRGDNGLELAVGLAATAAVQAKRIRAVKKRISQVFECLFEVGVCRVMFLYTDTLMHEARLLYHFDRVFSHGSQTYLNGGK